MQLWDELGRWSSRNGSQIREEPSVCWESCMGGQARASTSSSSIGRVVQRPWGRCCPWGPTVLCLVVGLGPLHGSQQPGRTQCRAEAPEGRTCLWHDHVWLCLLFYIHIPSFGTSSFILVHFNLEPYREGYFGAAQFASLINLTLHNPEK